MASLQVIGEAMPMEKAGRPHYSGSSSVRPSHGLMQKANEAALLKVLCKLLTQHGANNWYLDGFASAVSGGLS